MLSFFYFTIQLFINCTLLWFLVIGRDVLYLVSIMFMYILPPTLLLYSIKRKLITQIVSLIYNDIYKIILCLPFSIITSLLLILDTIILYQFVLNLAIHLMVTALLKKNETITTKEVSYMLYSWYKNRAFYIVYNIFLTKIDNYVNVNLIFTILFRFVFGYSYKNYKLLLKLNKMFIFAWNENYKEKNKFFIPIIFLWNLIITAQYNILNTNQNLWNLIKDKKIIVEGRQKIRLNSNYLKQIMDLLNMYSSSSYSLNLLQKYKYEKYSAFIGYVHLRNHVTFSKEEIGGGVCNTYYDAKVATHRITDVDYLIHNNLIQAYASTYVKIHSICAAERTAKIYNSIGLVDENLKKYFLTLEFKKFMRDLICKSKTIASFQDGLKIERISIEDLLKNYKDMELTGQQFIGLQEKNTLMLKMRNHINNLDVVDQSLIFKFIEEEIPLMGEDNVTTLLFNDAFNESYVNALKGVMSGNITN